MNFAEKQELENQKERYRERMMIFACSALAGLLSAEKTQSWHVNEIAAEAWCMAGEMEKQMPADVKDE